MAFFHFDAATMEKPPFQKEFVWLEPHPKWKIRYSRRCLGGDPKGSWVGLFFILDNLGDAHSNEIEHFPAGLDIFFGFSSNLPCEADSRPTQLSRLIYTCLIGFCCVSRAFSTEKVT